MKSDEVNCIPGSDTKIREHSLVLEIGSGNSPWIRSDILVDQYLEDSYGHRGGANIFIDNRPLLIASGHNLPLRDKSVDFVYSSQVLDHVEDPAAMLREMARVGKAGYLECSNPLMERFQSPPVHLWYVTAYDNKLYLAAKTPETNISTELDRFIFHLLSDHFLIKHYWSYFQTNLHWREKIDFELCDVKTVFSLVKLNPNYQEFILRQRTFFLFHAFMESLSFYFWGKIRGHSWGNILRRIWKFNFAKAHTAKKVRASPKVMRQILVCPKCTGPLSFTSNLLTCNRCGKEFSRQGNIFHFL